MSAVDGKVDVTPSAKRLTASLRDIGYDFVSAVADLVDNSISAGAGRVDVEVRFDGNGSYVLIADDGWGMTNSALIEALRFGSRRAYREDDLGRYGLGLKTASLSQCRRVTVVARATPVWKRISTWTLDLDHILESDRWELLPPPDDTSAFRALEWLKDSTGTVVVWENLDRVLPDKNPAGGWARRRLDSLARRTAEHLGMVFHRFIEDAAGTRLTMTVNGEKVTPWNPFAPDEEAVASLDPREYEVIHGDATGTVTLRRYVLPPRTAFSSHVEFDRMSGPAKWNRQQGLYIYRADRLIQSGGWCGIRSIDEHTKLARASLDFEPELDEAFQINVAKMRVVMPPDVRVLIEPHVTELCHKADHAYRREAGANKNPSPPPAGAPSAGAPSGVGLSSAGSAILAAALATGQASALEAIIGYLVRESPDLVSQLGW